jgi:4-hydroxy-tetrahydrodipicolinate reductase
MGEDGGFNIVAGFDAHTAVLDKYPVFASPSEFAGAADVLVDFSSPDALDDLLGFGLERRIPLVLCTTGYSPKQIEKISLAADELPIFRSGNMSLGINLVADLLRRAAAVLGAGFDVEIVEKHHRRKVDAPSGTAIMLADAVSESLPYAPDYVFERQSRREPRGEREIGISAVRGGTIVGEHDVIFAGTDEVIEIKHSAFSRDVFAVGAVRAAKFLAGVSETRLYTMSDVLAAIV